MNIALITDLAMPNIGGVEILLDKVSRDLVRKGHRVLMISNKPARKATPRESAGGVEHFRIYMGMPELKRPRTWLHYLLKNRSSKLALRNLVQDFNADIINVHFPGGTGCYVKWLKAKLDIPVIVSLHGNDVQLFPQISSIRRRCLIGLLTDVDFVTACSSKILDDAKRLVDYKAPDIPIRNGVDITEFDVAHEETGNGRYILAVGRLVRKKGFDILIEAFNKISNELSGIRLVIAGDGEEQQSLKKQIEDSGLTDRVEMTGAVDRRMLVSLFKQCMFFVLPSRQEPLGLVNLEAMASGKAVVAFAVDGVPEIIDRDVGVLVEPGDRDALAEAIKVLALQPEKAAMLGHNGRQRAVNEHDIRYTVQKYLDVYEKVLSVSPVKGK